jgi:mannose-6-phosphate isomerase-like protein (cupin superfamily)
MRIFLALTTLLASAVLIAADGDSGSTVNYLPSDKVAGALAKGGTLLNGPDFIVQGSHRDKAGNAELHVKETDVLYIIEGDATFVTGGTIKDRHEVRTDQIGGSGIEGGKTFHLKKGDVITIEAGTPHWFKETSGISYYVVKIKKP